MLSGCTLCQATGKDKQHLPLVIGKNQLDEVHQLKLTNSQSVIRFCQFGEVSEMQKTALLQNIAQNSPLETVTFANNLGDITEDVSGYIHRLRTDESTLQLAQLATDKIAENEPKYSPYFEEREINGRKGLYYIWYIVLLRPFYPKNRLFCPCMSICGQNLKKGRPFFKK